MQNSHHDSFQNTMQNRSYIGGNYAGGVNGEIFQEIFPQDQEISSPRDYSNSQASIQIIEDMPHAGQNMSPGSGAISTSQEILNAIAYNDEEAANMQEEEVKEFVLEIADLTAAKMDPTSVSHDSPFAHQYGENLPD
jgi:hypothetical protein